MLEEFQIVIEIGKLRNADAPLDAAHHRALLVAGEVDPGLLVNAANTGISATISGNQVVVTRAAR